MAVKPKKGKHPQRETVCECCAQSISNFKPGRFDIEITSTVLQDLGESLVGLSGIVSVDLVEGKIVLYTDIDTEAEYYERLREIKGDILDGLWDAHVEYLK